MGRLFTTRRSQWLPGVGILGSAVAIGSLIGVSVGARSWPSYVGLIVAVLFLMGWAERFRVARPERPRRRKPESNLRLIPGGKNDYDLEKDSSTDDQKYMM